MGKEHTEVSTSSRRLSTSASPGPGADPSPGPGPSALLTSPGPISNASTENPLGVEYVCVLGVMQVGLSKTLEIHCHTPLHPILKFTLLSPSPLIFFVFSSFLFSLSSFSDSWTHSV